MKKNANSQVLGLWQTYQNVKFRKLSDFWAENVSFYIVTACNPGSKLLSAVSNNLRTQKLKRYLISNGIDYREVICGDNAFQWQEHSFAIRLPEKRLQNLARLYNQNAVYFVDSGELKLVPVLMVSMQYAEMGKFKKYCVAK